MIRVTKLSGKYYAYDMGSQDDEQIIEDIRNFVSQGTPVIVVDSLRDLEDFEIYDDVIIVEPDE